MASTIEKRVPGRCLATALALQPGMDPGVEVAMDTIKLWVHFWHANPKLQGRIEATWKVAYSNWVRPEPQPAWPTRRGPVDAVVLTLRDLGWNPLLPHQWEDTGGTSWMLVRGFRDEQELIMQLRLDCQKGFWAKAAAHYLGSGLQQGADVHSLRLLLNRWSKQGKHQEAGALEAAAKVATWCRSRKAEVFGETDTICRRCQGLATQQHVETPVHRYWLCKANTGHADFRDSDGLLEEARKGQ